MKHIISLGAGVQSSTMALMAAKGFILIDVGLGYIYLEAYWKGRNNA